MASYDFSDEILFEIFSRAELKTMKKCRVLSKEWKDLTYESSFMRLHSERTSTMEGYLVQCSRIFTSLPSELVSIVNSGLDPKPTRDLLNFLPQPTWIVAAVNGGLVLCSRSRIGGNSFIICKPTTQQWEVIPSPKRRIWQAMISMLVLGSNPLRFKIVRLSDSRYDDIDRDRVSDSDSESEYSDEEDVSWHCEIFDSKSWEWKQSDDFKLTYYDSFENTQDVSACGGLHWLMFNHEQDKRTILSFDGDKEEWGMTSLPDSLGGKGRRVAHVSYQGKLGLINHSYETKMLDIWILNHEKIWIKKHTINLESINEKVSHSRFHSFYGADTLFMVDIGLVDIKWVSFYNFMTHKLNRIMVGGSIDSAYFIQTDSESVKLKPE